MKGRLFCTFLVAFIMFVLVISVVGTTFTTSRGGNYENPEVLIENYILQSSPNVIDELTSIFPAILFVDAGDMFFIQLSMPDLGTLPNSKMHRLNLSLNRIRVYRSESSNICHVNKLVEFVQATSVNRQSI